METLLAIRFQCLGSLSDREMIRVFFSEHKLVQRGLLLHGDVACVLLWAMIVLLGLYFVFFLFVCDNSLPALLCRWASIGPPCYFRWRSHRLLHTLSLPLVFSSLDFIIATVCLLLLSAGPATVPPFLPYFVSKCRQWFINCSHTERAGGLQRSSHIPLIPHCYVRISPPRVIDAVGTPYQSERDEMFT